MANALITDAEGGQTSPGEDAAFEILQGGVSYYTLWSLIKQTLKTYFDTLYQTLANAALYQTLANKDVSNGYAGLNLLKINFKNAADTFTSFLQNLNTAQRTYTFRDRDSKISERIVNYSTAAQSIPAATRTYITGSALAVPAGGLEIGTILRWNFNMTKTAAGNVASTFDIAFGTTGTTDDTARVTFTKPAGSAAADEAWVIIECIVRGPLSASGIVQGHFFLSHNLNGTGHATIANVNDSSISAGFDVTTPNLIIGVCHTSGAADNITIQQVSAEAINL